MITIPYKLVYKNYNEILSKGRKYSKLLKLIKSSKFIKINNYFNLKYNFPRNLIKQKFKVFNIKILNLKLYTKKNYNFLYFNSFYKMLSNTKKNTFYKLII